MFFGRSDEDKQLTQALREMGADTTALNVPKPLRLLFRYAENGGWKAIETFLDRLDENKLNYWDHEYIRHIYFPESYKMTRREANFQVASSAGALLFLPSWLATAHFEDAANNANAPADRQKYHRIAFGSMLVAVPSGLTFKVASYHREKCSEERRRMLRSSDAYKTMLFGLSDELDPVLEKLELLPRLNSGMGLGG